MSITVIHILAVGLGDTGGPMTERIPKQEMKHPLSPWTKDVRISPVLSGLRIAHKMFYSQHPVLKKKYTHTPNPVPGKGHSVGFASHTLSIHCNKHLQLPVVYQTLGHLHDKMIKVTEATHFGGGVRPSVLKLLVLL